MKCVTMTTTNARTPLPRLAQAFQHAKRKNEARDCSINICAIDCKGGVGAVAKLATQFPKQFGAVIDFSKKYGFYFFMAIMFVLVSTGLLFFIVIL